MSTKDHPNDSVIACCESLLIQHRQEAFWTALLLVMRRGSFIRMLNTIVSGSVKETVLLNNRKAEFIQIRSHVEIVAGYSRKCPLQTV